MRGSRVNLVLRLLPDRQELEGFGSGAPVGRDLRHLTLTTARSVM